RRRGVAPGDAGGGSPRAAQRRIPPRKPSNSAASYREFGPGILRQPEWDVRVRNPQPAAGTSRTGGTGQLGEKSRKEILQRDAPAARAGAGVDAQSGTV